MSVQSPQSVDYPREHGGTHCEVGILCCEGGLSPRARGNLPHIPLGKYQKGTIPASTGEPANNNDADYSSGDYPREHGGTSVDSETEAHGKGLSPRARGNRWHRQTREALPRTIPASTGEPSYRLRFPAHHWDYPREHGGTNSLRRRGTRKRGLSPRARGNPTPGWSCSSTEGTIPASTGEPCSGAMRTITGGDYPREHGGTSRRRRAGTYHQGLSPRARGNRIAGDLAEQAGGTIPASTGEPSNVPRRSGLSGDYPREHGGTMGPVGIGRYQYGLSPRARGNHSRYRRRCHRQRTIPASTGEPNASGVGYRRRKDYPREHGGTDYSERAGTLATGLSPRARGNRYRCRCLSDWLRTIPASTGEPPGQVPSCP